jgi:hypothetical protein
MKLRKNCDAPAANSHIDDYQPAMHIDTKQEKLLHQWWVS